MLKLLHACEIYGHQGKFENFLILNSLTCSKDIEKFLNELFRYNLGNDLGENLQANLKTMQEIEDDWIAPGGLIAHEDSFQMVPGCCCGLESWREWGALKKDAYSPWWGHDPDPNIDMSKSRPVLHNGYTDDPQELETSYENITLAFSKSEKEFEHFTQNLERYLRTQGSTNTDAFIRKFRNAFYVDEKAIKRGEKILSEAQAKLTDLGIKFQ